MSTYFILVALALLLPGCGPGSDDSIAIVASGVTYNPEVPWHGLSENELNDPKNEAVKTLVDSGRPVSVVYIGDRWRVYNYCGVWRPATLTIRDDNDVALRTIRLDLPALGTSHVPLDLLGLNEEQPIRFRMTFPSLSKKQIASIKENGPLVLGRPRIGTSSEEFKATPAKKRSMLSAITEGINNSLGIPPTDFEFNGTSAVSNSFKSTSHKMTSLFDFSTVNSGYGGNGEERKPDDWWARQAAQKYFEYIEQQK